MNRLRKLYPSVLQRRLTLLTDDMRDIITVLNLGRNTEVELWALWLAKWQDVMMGSEILSPKIKMQGNGTRREKITSIDYRGKKLTEASTTGAPSR